VAAPRQFVLVKGNRRLVFCIYPNNRAMITPYEDDKEKRCEVCSAAEARKYWKKYTDEGFVQQ
jgi:hypothetical protein